MSMYNMGRVGFIYFFLFSNAVLFGQKDPVAVQYGELVSLTELKENLTIIASDALEGRKTGSRGQKMAAAFIRAHFEEIGLQGPVGNGGYYQNVPLYAVVPGKASMNTATTALENLRDFVFLGLTESKGISPVVFVGDGEEASLEKIEVSGKVVLVISEKRVSGIPVAELLTKGAKAILICNSSDEATFSAFANRAKKSFDSRRMTLSRPSGSGDLESVVYVSPSAVEKILDTEFSVLKSYASDPKKIKRIRKVKEGSINYFLRNEIKQVNSENVLGYLEGSDKKDELIVVTSHYDHIGKLSEGTGDLINNGADDDGSGTVAVLQMAKVFAKAKEEGNGPRRSMLFMTVTGEEMGLFGSQYYAENPVFPLSNTVVDLNIDMIGRTDPEHKGKPDYVYVIGSDKLSQELHQISETINSTYTQLDFDYTYNDENHPTNLYKRSDHWNFAKNGIPIVFYFDGIHEDYHLPSDEVDKIDFELLTKRTKLVFYTAWELANRDERIKND
ncbi:MAG: M28 family metallopeptidase [Cyclobacteriaceae bacterium]